MTNRWFGMFVLCVIDAMNTVAFLPVTRYKSLKISHPSHQAFLKSIVVKMRNGRFPRLNPKSMSENRGDDSTVKATGITSNKNFIPVDPASANLTLSLENTVRCAFESFAHHAGFDNSAAACWPYVSSASSGTAKFQALNELFRVDDAVEYRDGALANFRGAAVYSSSAAAWRAQLLDECPDARCSVVRVSRPASLFVLPAKKLSLILSWASSASMRVPARPRPASGDRSPRSGPVR
jgi:hypothetical protein